jgi:hypothetical protein
MRRVVPLIAALAALALPAMAQAASPADVIRDCTLDGKLDRTYTQKELRRALAAIPSDVDEYTNCRDVISNAQLAAATHASSGTTGGRTPGATPPGGTGGGGTPGGTTSSAGGAFGGFANGPDAATATPTERAAIQQAREDVADEDPVEEASVALPAPLIGALAVGGLGLLVFLALDIRRRLVDRRGL